MADEQTNVQVDTEQAVETEAVNNPSTSPVQEEAQTQQPNAEASKDAKQEADRGLLKGAEEESVPESYDDFDLGEGVTEEEQAALKELAKKHGLPQDVAQKAAVFSRDVVQQITDSIKEQEAKAIEEFRAENKKLWESQPDHAQKTLYADKAVKHLGKDVADYLANSGHLYDARIISILAELGRLASEPTHVTGTDSAPSGSSRIYNNSPEMYSNS